MIYQNFSKSNAQGHADDFKSMTLAEVTWQWRKQRVRMVQQQLHATERR